VGPDQRSGDAQLGAALAYYSIFSLGPLMIIAIAIAGLVFGQEAVRGEVGLQFKGLLGDAGAQAVDAMLAGASKPQQGIVATVLGIALLLFAAVGVVVQLKDALNTVWEVEARKKGGIWQFVRTYLVSLAGVLALGFLLLVLLLLTTALAASGKCLSPHLPEAALQIVGSIASFGVITLLFAMTAPQCAGSLTGAPSRARWVLRRSMGCRWALAAVSLIRASCSF
jgi:membrane protein